MLDREPKAGDLISLHGLWFWSPRLHNSVEETIAWRRHSMPIPLVSIMPKNTPLLVVETIQHTSMLQVVFLYDGSCYDVNADAFNFINDFDIISSIENKNV